MRHTLDRRHLLRGFAGGLGARIALPALDAMLDRNGTALAATGDPTPRRLGVWFWGNGVRLDHWVPAATGTAWDATGRSHLQPFAALKPYVSIVSGTDAHVPFSAHHAGKNVVLTGGVDESIGHDKGYARSYGPSIDRIAAQQWKGLTPFDSLEFGVSRGSANNEPVNSGHYTSTNGPDSYNTPEYSPAKMFARMFASGASAVGDPLAAQRLAARRSILDLVLADAQRLQPRLGSADRARLDLHLDAIRAIERRLDGATAGGRAGCSVPAAAPGDFPATGGREPLGDRNRAMADLAALALACDLTRSFTFQFTVFQTQALFWEAGLTEGLHTITHAGAGGYPDTVKAIDFTMQQLAYFLARLRDTPDGAGKNLLDACAIMCTSEVAEGASHSQHDIPVLIAGGAGGRLRGGVHYRSTTNEQLSSAGLTVMRAVGLAVPSFGQGASQTSAAFAALMT